MAEEQPVETFDFRYVLKVPGAIIFSQAVCCFLGFVLGVSGPFSNVSSTVFFNITTFTCLMFTMVWLGMNICHIHRIFGKDINWNLMGLIHHGSSSFFLMVASSALIDNVYILEVYRAAGVFGFLAFSCSLVGLVYEFTIWFHHKTYLEEHSATVIRQENKAPSISDYDDDDDEWSSSEAPTDGVTVNAYRPRGSYIETNQTNNALLPSTSQHYP